MSNINDLVQLMAGNKDAIRPVADYFGGLAGGTFEQLWGLLLKDPITVWRWEKVQERIHNARKRLRDKGIEPGPVSPALGLPLIAGASNEDREELVELWEELIAASMDPDRAKKVRARYVDIIKKMDPEDALFLQCYFEYKISKTKEFSEVSGIKLSAVSASLINLEELKIVQSFPDPMGGIQSFYITGLGFEFCRAVKLLDS